MRTGRLLVHIQKRFQKIKFKSGLIFLLQMSTESFRFYIKTRTALNTFITMGPTGGTRPILRNYLIEKHFLFFYS